MSKITTFEDLFCHELSDLMNAETQLTKALQEMAEAASDPTLKEGFETHQQETEGQLEKIQQVFESIEMEPEKITCEAMKGLIKEGKDVISEFEEGPLRDCALIIAAQKVEHYEIAGYGSVCALAEKLGFDEAKELLGEILEEEKATDEKLTEAAENINEKAYDEVADAAE
ncbi:MAG TPA: ferritin-like domain-containing protein [Micavibrio sp.]|nr:ferritin-like domain-containing protein [Micavibrio sp.]